MRGRLTHPIPVGAFSSFFGSIFGIGGGIIALPILKGAEGSVGGSGKGAVAREGEAAADAVERTKGWQLIGSVSALNLSTCLFADAYYMVKVHSAAGEEGGGGAEAAGLLAELTTALGPSAPIIVPLSIAAAVGSTVGVRFIGPRMGASTQQLVFGVGLLATGVLVAVTSIVRASARVVDDGAGDGTPPVDEAASPPPHPITLAAIGFASGLGSATAGFGLGLALTSSLTLLTSMSHSECASASLAAATIPSIGIVAAHVRAGSMGIPLGPYLAAGAMGGAVAGSTVTSSANQTALRTAFSVFLLALGGSNLRRWLLARRRR